MNMSLFSMQVLSVVRTLAQEATGADVAPDVPLMSAGLDSLAAVELRNSVGRRFGVTLPATVAFDHPTLKVPLPFYPYYLIVVSVHHFLGPQVRRHPARHIRFCLLDPGIYSLFTHYINILLILSIAFLGQDRTECKATAA